MRSRGLEANDAPAVAPGEPGDAPLVAPSAPGAAVAERHDAEAPRVVACTVEEVSHFHIGSDGSPSSLFFIFHSLFALYASFFCSAACLRTWCRCASWKAQDEKRAEASHCGGK